MTFVKASSGGPGAVTFGGIGRRYLQKTCSSCVDVSACSLQGAQLLNCTSPLLSCLSVPVPCIPSGTSVLHILGLIPILLLPL